MKDTLTDTGGAGDRGREGGFEFKPITFALGFAVTFAVIFLLRWGTGVL